MSKLTKISINGEEFVITQNFNPDNNSDNIDIYNTSNKYIGELEGHCIPEDNADEEEIRQFKKVVEEWLIDC